MSPPKASTMNSKEKLKQMRLPFAPIQKDNAINKQKEEQSKEIEKAAEEKQKKLEAERIAKEEELRLWAEEEAKKQREEMVNATNKENEEAHPLSSYKELQDKKRKLSDSAEKNEISCKKANSEMMNCADGTSQNDNRAILKLAKEQQKERERIEKLEEKQKERMKKEKEKKEKEEEKERQRKVLEVEKEKQKKEKEEEKERLRKEKEEEKERQRKEKEEEREKLRKEREEKERLRKEKEDEKERLKKEKELEKLKQEKAERDKQAKVAKVFENFFIKSPPLVKKEFDINATSKLQLNFNEFDRSENSRNHRNDTISKHLSLFNVKNNMRLAPLSRNVLKPEDKKSLETLLSYSNWQDYDNLYLNKLKKDYIPSKQGKTWPVRNGCKLPGSNECSDEYDTPLTEEEDEEDKTAWALHELDGDSIVDIPELFNIKTDSKNEISINKNNPSFCKMKAKLLQFHTNERPPYWGTWSKRSNSVGPRRPFAKDSNHFDYEYDSDDDWEEEERGESLSDEEKDVEEDQEEDEDDDDGFFVGHGVLDKDEAHLIESDEENSQTFEGSQIKSKDKLEEDLEMKKMRLRAELFEELYKKQKSMPPKLKPRVFGCFWKNNFDQITNNNIVSREKIIHDKLMKIFTPYDSVLVDDNQCVVLQANLTINTSFSLKVKPSPSSKLSDNAATPKVGENLDTSSSLSSKKTPGRPKAKVFPEDAIPHLIRLVHGNSHNKIFLVKEFSAFLQTNDRNGENNDEKESDGSSTKEDCDEESKELEVPKTKIVAKLQEIAEYKRWPDTGRMANKMCWIVKPEVLADPKWKINDLKELEENGSSWNYILEQPKNVGPGRTPNVNEQSDKESGIKSNSASPSNTPKRKAEECSIERISDKRIKSPAPSLLITKFAKILTPEDRMKQMTKLREKAEAEREEANRQLQEKLAAITKELIEEKSMFNVGDLVWGTMKGFPSWPGKIVVPPDVPDLKRPAVKKLLHCIKFFGTYDYAWLAEQDVKPYLQFKESLSKGSKAQNFQRALKEIDEFSLGKKLIDSIKEPMDSSVCGSPQLETKNVSTEKEESNA